MEIKKEDIEVLNKILELFTRSSVEGGESDLSRKRLSEIIGGSASEVTRICTIIIEYGAASLNTYTNGITRNNNTKEFFELNKFEKIYNEQQEKKKTAVLQQKQLSLDVKNKGWEGVRYCITTGISLLALIISIIALLK